MLAEFKKAEGVDLSEDKMAMQRLKEAAEKAKKELSSAMTTNINLPFITATPEGPKHFDVNLSRAQFEELTHDLVERTAIPVQNAMKDAGLTNAIWLCLVGMVVFLSISLVATPPMVSMDRDRGVTSRSRISPAPASPASLPPWTEALLLQGGACLRSKLPLTLTPTAL